MSDIAIRVESLSKAYRIGLKEQQHETMLGAMAAWVKSPLRNFREVRNLSRFNDVGSDVRTPTSDLSTSQSDVIWALKNVSFEVKHGEALGIIGRNGAGKSTLLKILARITEPTSGRATIYGRVGSLLEVGTGFHPDLTGRENVYLNGTILGMKKREVDDKFDEIIDFSGVEKFIDTPVKRYSSGMRVRLAFAVAAHLEPEILIVDEVLAVGDAEFQKKCLGKMVEIAAHGRTVLFVSHNLGAVRQLCTSGMVLDSGHITCAGSPTAAAAYYVSNRNEKVGTILGHLRHVDDQIRIHSIEVNNSESDRLTFSPSDGTLTIRIRGCLMAALRMDLEVRLMDLLGTPLALYSPGHMTGTSPLHSEGPFVLTRVVSLPNGITRGQYHLSFSLTHHNIASWADLPRCVTLACDGVCTASGRTIDYNSGAGWLVLR
jgi:lipopolysaccharide transport system ATP-binding protein